jgi:hypothetical protein
MITLTPFVSKLFDFFKFHLIISLIHLKKIIDFVTKGSPGVVVMLLLCDYKVIGFSLKNSLL